MTKGFMDMNRVYGQITIHNVNAFLSFYSDACKQLE